MSGAEVWGNKPRTATDLTLIDEAIGTAVNAHNDDPDAHLGADQALQSHRAAEIIDHLAESVVNDKIAPSSRAFTAIVDPASESDYDTIVGALAYVISKGGGTILVRAGDHFITSTLDVPMGIQIIGEGELVTVIHCDNTASPAIDFTGNIATSGGIVKIENCSFVLTDGYVFTNETSDLSRTSSIIFSHVSFEGGGQYGHYVNKCTAFIDCMFDCDGVGALDVIECYFNRCTFVSDVAAIIFSESAGATDKMHIVGYDCVFDLPASDFQDGNAKDCIWTNSTFGVIDETLPFGADGDVNNKFYSCKFIADTDSDIYIRGDAIFLIMCTHTAVSHTNSTAYIRLSATSSYCTIQGCYLIHEVKSNLGVNNLIVNNVLAVDSLGDIGSYPTFSFSSRAGFTGYTHVSNGILKLSNDGMRVAQILPTTKQVKLFKYGGSTYDYESTITASVAYGAGAVDYNPYDGKLYMLPEGGSTLGIIDLSVTTPSLTEVTMTTVSNIRTMKVSGNAEYIVISLANSANGNNEEAKIYKLAAPNYTLASTIESPTVYINDLYGDSTFQYPIDVSGVNYDGSLIALYGLFFSYSAPNQYYNILIYRNNGGTARRVFVAPWSEDGTPNIGVFVDSSKYVGVGYPGYLPHVIQFNGTTGSDTGDASTYPPELISEFAASPGGKYVLWGRTAADLPKLYVVDGIYLLPLLDITNASSLALTYLMGTQDGKYWLVKNSNTPYVYRLTN